MAEQAWEQSRERVAAELATLTDREFLIVGEPVPEPEPRRGLFRRRPGPVPTRYVQFLRAEDAVTAECVGAKSFGGYVDISPVQDERLRALGWKAPGDTDDVLWGAPNYRLTATPAETDRLSRLAVDSLEVLGLTPGSVEFTRDK